MMITKVDRCITHILNEHLSHCVTYNATNGQVRDHLAKIFPHLDLVPNTGTENVYINGVRHDFVMDRRWDTYNKYLEISKFDHKGNKIAPE